MSSRRSAEPTPPSEPTPEQASTEVQPPTQPAPAPPRNPRLEAMTAQQKTEASIRSSQLAATSGPPPEGGPSMAQLAAASAPRPSSFDPTSVPREPVEGETEGKFPLDQHLEGVELFEGHPRWQVLGAAASKGWERDKVVTREEISAAVKEWLEKPVEPTTMDQPATGA